MDRHSTSLITRIVRIMALRIHTSSKFKRLYLSISPYKRSKQAEDIYTQVNEETLRSTYENTGRLY